MWNGMKKAITFSYDDGVTQDRRLVKIFDKYGLKATFNLNSGFLGTANSLVREGVTVAHCKPRACEVREIYKNHEIAAHTLTHPSLPSLPDEEIVRQVEDDRLALSEIAGYEVVGMAYPGGGKNCDERTAEIIRKRTGIKYARTVESSRNFAKQSDLILFKPTEYFMNTESLFSLAEAFLNAPDDGEDRLFYIWGHAYELDGENGISWEKFEDFCRLISGKTNVFYGTNKEVLL